MITSRGCNREEVITTVEGVVVVVVVRMERILLRGCLEEQDHRGRLQWRWRTIMWQRVGGEECTNKGLIQGLGRRRKKNAKEAIGKAWGKFFHYVGITGRNADNPYFVSAVRETQKWGKYLYLETYGLMYLSIFSFFAYGFR
jgi:hypothetical protein